MELDFQLPDEAELDAVVARLKEQQEEKDSKILEDDGECDSCKI